MILSKKGIECRMSSCQFSYILIKHKLKPILISRFFFFSWRPKFPHQIVSQASSLTDGGGGEGVAQYSPGMGVARKEAVGLGEKRRS